MTSKILWTTLLILGLSACSSSPTKIEESPASNAGDSPSDVWDKGSAAPTAAPVKNEKPAPMKAEVSKDPWSDLNAAIKSQNDEQIRSVSSQILMQVPGDDRALNSLAMYHYKKGHFDLAAYLLGKAIQKNPRRAALHSNLGLVQLAKNDRLIAIKSFRRALEVDADDGIANANLGSIYVAERDFMKAAVVLEMAYRRGIRDGKALNNFGVALMATGKPERALSIFQEGLKDNPNSRELLMNQAIVLVDHLHQYKEGLDAINRLKFVGAPSESRDRLSSLENEAKAGVK